MGDDRTHAPWVGRTQPTLIRRVAWSPDGTRLVGGGDDGYVYLWDAADGTQQQRLVGHDGTVMSVAWSPDGMRLASGGGGREGGDSRFPLLSPYHMGGAQRGTDDTCVHWYKSHLVILLGIVERMV